MQTITEAQTCEKESERFSTRDHHHSCSGPQELQSHYAMRYELVRSLLFGRPTAPIRAIVAPRRGGGGV